MRGGGGMHVRVWVLRGGRRWVPCCEEGSTSEQQRSGSARVRALPCKLPLHSLARSQPAAAACLPDAAPAPCLPACPCSLTRVGIMVLVCHESNDIFLEAAKVCRGRGRGALGRREETPGSLCLSLNPPSLPHGCPAPPPPLQMARYAKNNTLTTALFVGGCAVLSPSRGACAAAAK